MKVKLPCRLGEVFEATPSTSGHTRRLRLTGFHRGMQMMGEYKEAMVYAESEHGLKRNPYVNPNEIVYAGEYPKAVEVEIPDALLEVHPLAEDGIQSKRKGEVVGVSIRDGGARFSYLMPDRMLQHHISPQLEQYLAAIAPLPEQALDEPAQYDIEQEPGQEQTM